MIKKPYDLAELIKRWEREDLTVEQAVGQILIWLILVVERLEKLEMGQRRRKPSEDAE